ncbi:MAG: hypothetical protein A3K04_11270 [Gallionellales bacterium RBG_16_56_9]|nr:MAG: hypothetical protein A3K04_11270 [Gallionellales bacterium RBG_16_56_9]
MSDPRLLTRLLAVAITLTAMAMAAVAAWDRGGSALDRALLMALSVAICAGTHLIPALSKRRLAWLLWAGCLLGTVYGHLVFFTHASLRAGDNRAQYSVQMSGVERQIEAAQSALDGITARPVTVVAAELADTQGSRQRSALRLELAEARRAGVLRDELVILAGAATTVQSTVSSDPVTARLAAVTGSSEVGITIAIGIGFSILLELVGALLWCEALRPNELPKVSHPEQDPIADLKEAVATGVCKPTVNGIRVFMGCGQAKAMEIRRRLLALKSGLYWT